MKPLALLLALLLFALTACHLSESGEPTNTAVATTTAATTAATTTTATRATYSENWQTAAVDFYYRIDLDILTYQTATITREHLSSETVAYMKQYANFQLNSLWYEGTRLCVDINKEEEEPLDAGSSAGIFLTNMLLRTFASFPNVEEIVFLIDGVPNVEQNHFNFDRVFNVNDDIFKEYIAIIEPA